MYKWTLIIIDAFINLLKDVNWKRFGKETFGFPNEKTKDLENFIKAIDCAIKRLLRGFEKRVSITYTQFYEKFLRILSTIHVFRVKTMLFS